MLNTSLLLVASDMGLILKKGDSLLCFRLGVLQWSEGNLEVLPCHICSGPIMLEESFLLRSNFPPKPSPTLSPVSIVRASNSEIQN